MKILRHADGSTVLVLDAAETTRAVLAAVREQLADIDIAPDHICVTFTMELKHTQDRDPTFTGARVEIAPRPIKTAN